MKIVYIGIWEEVEARGIVFKKGIPVEVKEEIGKALIEGGEFKEVKNGTREQKEKE